MQTPLLSHAVVYHPTTMNKSSSNNSNNKGTQTQTPTPAVPSHYLYGNHDDHDRLYMPALSSFKQCSLVLGLLVGLFIYLSTLGAEFVGVMLWGKEILEKSNHELIVFSLAWNLITTLLAIVILSSLRKLVSVVFLSAMATTNRSLTQMDDILSELLSYMEGRFAVGALVGICGSWNVTNAVLGMKPQILQSLVILVVACLWCRVTLVLLGSPEEVLIYDEYDCDEYDEECDCECEKNPQRALTASLLV